MSKQKLFATNSFYCSIVHFSPDVHPCMQGTNNTASLVTMLVQMGDSVKLGTHCVTFGENTKLLKSLKCGLYFCNNYII